VTIEPKPKLCNAKKIKKISKELSIDIVAKTKSLTISMVDICAQTKLFGDFCLLKITIRVTLL